VLSGVLALSGVLLTTGGARGADEPAATKARPGGTPGAGTPNKHPDGSVIHTSVGVRGTTHRVRIAESPTDKSEGGALGLEAQALAYMRFGSLSARYTHRLAIAWGPRDWQGGAGLDLALGPLLLVAPNTGLFARAGVRAHYFWEAGVKRSILEAPQLQLGVERLGDGVHAELGGRSGWAWTGSVDLPTVAEQLARGLEWGGYGALTLGVVHMGLELSQVTAIRDANEGTVSEIHGFLCGLTSIVVVCADWQSTRIPPGEGHARADVVGLFVGRGGVERR